MQQAMLLEKEQVLRDEQQSFQATAEEIEKASGCNGEDKENPDSILFFFGIKL